MLKANCQASTAATAGETDETATKAHQTWAQVDQVQAWLGCEARGAAAAFQALVRSVAQRATEPKDATAAAEFLAAAFQHSAAHHASTLERVMDHLHQQAHAAEAAKPAALAMPRAPRKEEPPATAPAYRPSRRARA